MKLISAEKMIKDTETMRNVCDAIEIDGIKKYIAENSFEAEVEPIRHGRWVRSKLGDVPYFNCTACNSLVWDKSAYCPLCGAKMDEATE